MKKWMKACMVTGLSCMIVGAVLYGAGYVFGGKTYVRTADLNHFGTSGASEQTASSILPKTQVDDYLKSGYSFGYVRSERSSFRG